MKKKANEKGITLIALIVAVIILVLLAAISIGVLNNGIIDRAGNAKDSAEVAGEKEIIKQSAIMATVKNKYTELTESGLQSSLETNSNGNANIIDSDDESYTIKFTDSGRYYEVDNQGKIEKLDSNGEKTLTVQCVNSAGTVLEEKTYTIVKNTYSKNPIEVAEYEVANEGKIEGEITANKTIQVLYYLKCYDDKTLVFTGLDSSGNTTADESAIVSYMVGNGSSTYGNGMKSEAKSIQSVLYIPETYNGKPVTKVGKYSLGQLNFSKTVIADNVETIADSSIKGSSLGILVLGKNLKKIEVNGLSGCKNVQKIIFRCNQFNTNMATYFPKYSSATMELDSNEDKFILEDGVLYSKTGETIYYVEKWKTGTFTVSSSVTTIFNYSFSYSRLTTVIIPDSVTLIKDEAFLDSYIQEITIGAGVTSIGSRAFTRCSSLTTVIIDSSRIASGLTSKTYWGNLINYATTIYIKDNITTIGSYVTTNFTIADEQDKDGYVKYVKNT